MGSIDVTRLSELIIRRLQDLARPSETDSSSSLQAIIEALVGAGLADDAGITKSDGSGDLRTLAPSSQLVRDAVAAQYELSQDWKSVRREPRLRRPQ